MRKNGIKQKNVWIESETKDFRHKILDSEYKRTKYNMLKMYEGIGK